MSSLARVSHTACFWHRYRAGLEGRHHPVEEHVTAVLSLHPVVDRIGFRVRDLG